MQLGAVKISILMFYLRIFAAPRLRAILKLTAVFVAALAIASSFAQFFQCTPLKSNWTSVNTDGTPLAFTCVNTDGLQFSTGGLNLATDIWILLLPIPSLKSTLQMLRLLHC